MPDYSYIGKGKVFLAKLGEDKLRFVGNCEKVELSFSEETKELKDFTHAGGGIANSVSRIDKVEVALNLFDYSPENLAMAVFGESNSVDSGRITGEAHIAYKNHLIKLERSRVTKVSVKDTKGDKTYIEGTDYEVLNAGIMILENGKILDRTSLTIDYDYGAVNVIHALMNSGNEYRFVFDGLNEAQSGKAVVLDIHRVKFTPAASLSFISDDFGSIEITGTALADISKTALGISRYFKVEMEQ